MIKIDVIEMHVNCKQNVEVSMEVINCHMIGIMNCHLIKKKKNQEKQNSSDVIDNKTTFHHLQYKVFIYDFKEESLKRRGRKKK